MAFILGVSGGSGSGKTYFARKLLETLPENACSLIYQDNFYIDQSSKFDYDGGSVNFDHPDSIDFSLLAMDQLVNNAAKWSYMFDGKATVPLVVN